MPQKVEPHPLVSELRAIRKAWGLSQEEMAERAGVSPRFMSDMEIGSHAPNLARAGRVADALGYDIVLRPKKIGG